MCVFRTFKINRFPLKRGYQFLNWEMYVRSTKRRCFCSITCVYAAVLHVCILQYYMCVCCSITCVSGKLLQVTMESSPCFQNELLLCYSSVRSLLFIQKQCSKAL
ncbi:unnamed protein product [Pipistrellus nathusii]|uniref:Uncharacterized protein n=1 Tax=Pipistrellus nathusii TaxID=59473 RepID=A0ABN9ZDQ4_PIPNA